MRLASSLRMVLCAVLLSVFPLGSQAGADEGLTIDDASPQEVVGGMANKAVRGVANVTTGWLELPKQIANTMKEEGVAKGLTVGPLKGLGMALVRTAAGVGETFTFFMAYPGFYDPYFDPPYVWQKE